MIVERGWYVEAGVIVGLLSVAVLLSRSFGVPFVVPDYDAATFLGLHYIVPLIALGAATVYALARRQPLSCNTLAAIPAYAIVLWLHFNIKLWVPLINPANYDAVFWASDQAVRPLVDGAIALRRWIGLWSAGYADAVYMNGFILMFYLSFIVHAVRAGGGSFRRLVLSAMLFQGLGALAYLAFPAAGPFIYEAGVDPSASSAQRHMLAVRHDLLSGGAAWLATEGSRAFVAPLAAMPSLHAGGAYLFVRFAWRHCRMLLPLYLPLFAFIVVGAIANRFHYVIDLPVGIALAALAIRLADRLIQPSASTCSASSSQRSSAASFSARAASIALVRRANAAWSRV